MNKSQRIVAGIVLIVMGIILFILVASNILEYCIVNPPYFRRHMFELYPIILLGIALTGGGIFVLVSKKK